MPDFPPSTVRAIETAYDEVLHPLLFPPREEHIQPILDSFINDHDPVLGNDTVYTTKARIRETGVELDAVLRECRRIDEKPVMEAAGDGRVTLDEVKRVRLRCRLQSQAVSPSEGMSKERIMREVRERRQRFDEEMRRAEEEALRGFKEGLRNAVAL